MTTRRVKRIRRSPLPKPTFSAEDLIAAIEAAQAERPASQGLTTTELMDQLGWPRVRVRRHLETLADAGRLIYNREMRPSKLDGIPRPTTVYSVRS